MRNRHRVLWGLAIGTAFIAVALLIRKSEEPNSTRVKQPVVYSAEQSRVTQHLNSVASAPVSVRKTKREILESVGPKIEDVVRTLKSSEKARSKVISKVDNEAVSHVRIWIPAPSESEILNTRRSINEITKQLGDAGISQSETPVELSRLEDYIDYGTNKDMNKAYRNRVLNIDVRHTDGGRLVATLMSAENVDYGTQEGSGVPWVRTSGASKSTRLDADTAISRYGHLFFVKDTP